ncbi:hypothetical protein VTK56DRAFT_10276 [Thermocarpiscus australiensis]
MARLWPLVRFFLFLARGDGKTTGGEMRRAYIQRALCLDCRERLDMLGWVGEAPKLWIPRLVLLFLLGTGFVMKISCCDGILVFFLEGSFTLIFLLSYHFSFCHVSGLIWMPPKEAGWLRLLTASGHRKRWQPRREMPSGWFSRMGGGLAVQRVQGTLDL